MKAEIITVGTEILIGSITNTNSKFLSERLVELGCDVNRQVSVNDYMDDIIRELKIASESSDLIFLCGGLGPTKDDITRQALAKFLNRDIHYDEKSKKQLEEYFKNSGKNMTENNLRQVMLIDGAKKFDNLWGLALGEVDEYEGKKYFLFPGPPREFEPMVNRYLAENISEDQVILIKSLNVIGLGESLTEDRLRKLNLENEYLSINTFAHFSQTEIKIIAEGRDYEFLNMLLEDTIAKLYREFDGHIYSESNETVEEVLVNKLREKNLKISFAESITGGLLAGEIINSKGASNVISTSLVTYTNESKNKELGVAKEILDEYGAVSKETAIAMAKGLRERTGADICVSTTGEAGPDAKETDIGSVFSCIYFADGNFDLKHYYFTGNRNKIRRRTVDQVLSNLLYLILKEEE